MYTANRFDTALVGSAIAIFSLAAPTNALGQSCSSSAQSQSYSSLGNLNFAASTTQQSCSSRTTQVSGWIQGQAADCLEPWDSYDSQGNCFAQSTSGNAMVTVGESACGTWDGKSNHKYVEGGSTTTIQTGRTTTLNAGSCEEVACRLQGPEYTWAGSECVFNPGSPIIIQLEKGAAYRLTSAEHGVQFDLNGDGAPEQIAWTHPAAGIAFLAMDRDGDARITTGKELFGNFTVPGISNGFAALQALAMETNGGVQRGSVSSDDPIFSQLLLWTDRNHNGVSEESELRPAGELIAAVGLGYFPSSRRDGFGNQYRYRGWVHVRTAPGRNDTTSPEEDKTRTRPIWDVFFVGVQ